jgi:putative SOS response-associated peptidase YedK
LYHFDHGSQRTDAPLHEQILVILDPASEEVWLNPRAPADALRSLFVPYASERMGAIAVSPWVSNARNQGPRCLEPAGA